MPLNIIATLKGEYTKGGTLTFYFLNRAGVIAMVGTPKTNLTQTLKYMSKVTENEVGKWGGRRVGQGRKKRVQEEELITRLYPMEDAAFQMLRKKIEEGDMKAVQLFLNYYIGLPTQKIESKIEGNLSQVSIEVIKTISEDKSSKE